VRGIADQDGGAHPDVPAKRAVSLILGSGGARGLAHIGVIGWLEENGYEIRSITGSSMGSLVGGIHAAGRLDSYASWVRAISRADVVRLLDFSFRRSGLIKGQRIIGLLRDLVGESDIESLPRAFAAVATDIEAGEEIWFTQGPLFDAIRASIAMPTFFTPHKLDGRLLLDGGITNPLPVSSPVRADTDFCVAVSLYGQIRQTSEVAPSPPSSTRDQLNGYRKAIVKFMRGIHPADSHVMPGDWGLLDVVTRSIDTLQGTLTRLRLATHPPDVLVEIPRNACGAFEFYRADELIALGRRAAAEAMRDQSSAA
jgi:NTE family protein